MFPIIHEMQDLKNVTQIPNYVLFEIKKMRLCLASKKIKENDFLMFEYYKKGKKKILQKREGKMLKDFLLIFLTN